MRVNGEAEQTGGLSLKERPGKSEWHRKTSGNHARQPKKIDENRQ